MFRTPLTCLNTNLKSSKKQEIEFELNESCEWFQSALLVCWCKLIFLLQSNKIRHKTSIFTYLNCSKKSMPEDFPQNIHYYNISPKFISGIILAALDPTYLLQFLLDTLASICIKCVFMNYDHGLISKLHEFKWIIS